MCLKSGSIVEVFENAWVFKWPLFMPITMALIEDITLPFVFVIRGVDNLTTPQTTFYGH